MQAIYYNLDFCRNQADNFVLIKLADNNRLKISPELDNKAFL
jgi:hypothetical protein